VLVVFGSKKVEIERKCKRDGTVWYLTPAEAAERRPNALIRAGTRTYATGSRVSLGSRSKAGGATQLMQMESQEERIRRNSSCPTCGSKSFTERKVKS
jgi:hypothetical protein